MVEQPHHIRRAASLNALLDTAEAMAPPGRRGDISPVRTTPPGGHAPIPVNLGVVDHLRRHAGELRNYANRARLYGPLPAAPARGNELYEWAQHAVPADQRIELEAIAWRHAVEDALLLDDQDQRLIRQQPCPACKCWGVVWDQGNRAVRCGNRRCVDGDGVPTTWTLRQFAWRVARRAGRRRTATS